MGSDDTQSGGAQRPAASAEVASFYHLKGLSLEEWACAGTACFAARHLDRERWHRASTASPRLYCLGKCFASPAEYRTAGRPRVEVRAPTPILLERIAEGGARSLQDYLARDGYQGLRRVLRMQPEELIRHLEVSGLRGRGGAGFPTGRKVRAVASQAKAPKYVVMNADEGDPGAFLDRLLLEEDPFAALEGLSILAYAVGASRGFIYLRREYPQAWLRLQEALNEARAAGALGRRVWGQHFSFDLELVLGEGSYLCGEETALLNALEGRRPFVRSRPPYPSEHGLWGAPTLVQNVETLAAVPWLVRHGGAAYAELGFSHSRGTKLLSLNSLFARPGLYEVEFGISLRDIVHQLGGGLATGASPRALLLGGPLAGLLPPRIFDTKLGFEELQAVGGSVGHGGVIAFDAHTSMRELVHHVFSFGAYESCGRCTPCRLGAPQLEAMFSAEAGAVPWNLHTFESLVSALQHASLCGHGTGLAEFARSVLRYFREELLACFPSP